MASNTVTFNQTGPMALSMRVVPVLVEVDGMAAPHLELLEVTRSRGPQLNRARFRLVEGADGQEARWEKLAQAARPGQKIRVGIICPADPTSGQQRYGPIFAGVIYQGQAQMSGSAEGVEIQACDEWTWHDGAAIDGIRALGPAGEAVYIRSAGAVFNPDGKPNCSVAAAQVNGKSYEIFQLETSQGRYWSYAAALRYLAAEGRAGEALDMMGLAGLEELTQGQVLRDVDVMGLTPLDAMDRLCRQAGLGFCLEQVPVGDNEVKEVLRFYRSGQGRCVFLRHQQAHEKLDLARTNVISCRIDTLRPSSTIRAVGLGDYQRYEATFKLVGGWDASLELNDYDLYSPVTNANFLQVREVFRKWVLNEAGDYAGPPYNRGPAYDLSGVFGTQNYSPRRRRFWPCLSTDTTGKSLGYYLEVSYDNGVSWQVYPGAFDVLLDECGVYLTVAQLETSVWNAIKKDVLRFRMTATLVADERLTQEVVDGPVDTARRVRTEVFELGGEFRYQQVTERSIFYQLSGTGRPKAADDRAPLRGRLREQIHQLRQSQLAGSAQLTFLRPDLWPGDVVTGLSGRDLSFHKPFGAVNNLTDNIEYAPQVQKVIMSLDNKWSTTIIFGEG